MPAVKLTKNYDAAQAGDILRRGTLADRQALLQDLIEHNAVIELEVSALKKKIKALHRHGHILQKFIADVKWRVKHR